MGYPSFIKEVGTLRSGEKLCIVEPAASKPYFYNNPSRPGYTEQNSFVMPKPENTIRIFLIGESAAKGYPQPKNLSMSSFLQVMLSDIKPDKKIEIINLGTTAVASFPIIYIVRDALRYDPDLFISYTGNNEFFGAYGTASINSTGIFRPWILPVLRWIHGLAIVQASYEMLGNDGEEKTTLMEQMIGQAMVDQDDSMREEAAGNLKYSLQQITDEVKSFGGQLLFCTTASNESGLQPLGEENLKSINTNEREKIFQLWNEGKILISQNPQRAVDALLSALAIAPQHAGINFTLAQAYAALGEYSKAKELFITAKNLDTMPWRPIEKTENAIREVAKNNGVPLCDIAESFRNRDGENTDWDLIDDHVHLSIKGQAEAARLILKSIARLNGNLAFDIARVETLPDWKFYAEKLGYNIYDEYRVNHTLRVLFAIPFMKRSNEEAFNRFNRLVKDAEEKMSPGVRNACLQWQTSKPHAGGLRPITGMVARILIRENRLKEALSLYQIAKQQVPEYTSWYLEYLYFELALREQLSGVLTHDERKRAHDAIMQGRFLLEHGFSETGLTERYIGRLFQLRSEWSEAIPFLLSAKPKMSNEDLVACDHALVMSYIKTGNKNAAVEIVNNGIRFGGKYSNTYKRFLMDIQNNKSL